MKSIAFVLLFVCASCITINAQQKELVINNANAGTLTLDKEDYSDVYSLVLKGRFNANDLKAIGEACAYKQLQPSRLDMTDVKMVGVSIYENDFLSTHMFQHEMLGLKYVATPLSIKEMELNGKDSQWKGPRIGNSYAPVDTMIVGGGSYKNYYDALSKYEGWLYKWQPYAKNLIIREGTEIVSLGQGAGEHPYVENVILPSSIKRIEREAFVGFTSLKSINIPDDIEYLGSHCFVNTQITYAGDTLFIPKKVKFFALDAYGTGSDWDLLYSEYAIGKVKVVVVPEGLDTLYVGCNYMNGINVSFCMESNTPPILLFESGFGYTEQSLKKCRLYVPKGSKSIYEVTNYWKNATIIEFNPLETILLDKHSASMEIGETMRLIPTFIPSDADDKTLEWSVKDESVAKVENGVVTALAPGKTWVYASSVVEDVMDSCEVTVIQHVTDITFDTPAVTLEGIGATVQLNVIVTPEDATDKSVTWSSSNPSVCVVSNCKIVAVGYGTSVVIATSVDGGHMAVATVKVNEAGFVTLTIQQSANGAVSTPVEKGSVQTFAIQAESGWKIHSVTFNDADVTSELDATNHYTTPTITENSTLFVTFEEDTATDVKAKEVSDVRVQGTSFGVRILNATNETANIYTPDGVLVKAVKVTGAQMDVELPEGGIYLVKVATKTVKVSR